MGKIGKTFTIDIDIYNWLEQHAKDKNRKVSYIVNAALRQTKRSLELWICPECKASNDNRFNDCHNCDYVRLK
jgi:ribosomal protein L40E